MIDLDKVIEKGEIFIIMLVVKLIDDVIVLTIYIANKEIDVSSHQPDFGKRLVDLH